ncbi:MAG: hypothetical protein JNJ76_00080 [Candidatus Competibacter sp.]|nr:hypothetical protein [Candidatus Competibacter sp.]
MRLSSVSDGFQLRAGQAPLAHHIGRQFRAVAQRRELDRSHRRRLGERRRMRLRPLERRGRPVCLERGIAETALVERLYRAALSL